VKRSKAAAIVVAAGVTASVLLAPAAFATGDSGNAATSRRASDQHTPDPWSIGDRNGTSPGRSGESGLFGLTGLLTNTLNGRHLGAGNGNGRSDGQVHRTGHGWGQGYGQSSGAQGDGQTVHAAPVSVNLGSSAARSTGPGPSSVPTPSPTAANVVTNRRSSGSEQAGGHAPAPASSPEPHLAAAPSEVPSLPVRDGANSAAAAAPAAPGARQQAAFPVATDDIEDGTAVLVGVMIVFMIGVVSVVVSAGYRSRRAAHRAD